MAKGISIGVALDTKDSQQAIKAGLIDPLEKVDKGLTELGNSNDVEALERDLRQAQEPSEDLRRDIDKVKDALQDAGRAGRSIGNDVRVGTREAGEGLHNFKEEAHQTARESAASFDGSAQSIVDAFQEVSANAFIGFGPAGMVAGLAAAAGIGLISAALQNSTDDAAELKTKVADLTQELLDTKSGAASIDYLVDKIKSLAAETADGTTNLADLRKVADASHNDFRKLAQAYAGNTEGLKDLWREGARRLDQLQDEADAVDTTTNAGVRRNKVLADQITAQSQYLDYLGQSLGVARQAAQADENYAKSGARAMEEKVALIEAAKDATEEARQAAYDSMSPMEAITKATTDAETAEHNRAQAVADGTEDSADSWEDYAGRVQASADQLLTAFEEQIAAQEAWNGNSETVRQKYGDATLKFFQDMGPQGKAALQTAIDSWSETDWSRLQADTQRQMTAAGSAAGAAYGRAVQDSVPQEVRGPRVVLGREAIDQLKTELDDLQYRKYEISIGVRYPNGKPVLQ